MEKKSVSNKSNEAKLNNLISSFSSQIKDQYHHFRSFVLNLGPDVNEEIKKSMGCYRSYSRMNNKELGLVWIEPHQNDIVFHLRNDLYFDKYNIINPEGWGGYPQLKVTKDMFDPEMISYLEKLIEQAYQR